MVTAMKEMPEYKYKPSIGKRWFLLLLTLPAGPGFLGMFVVTWGWILKRVPPAPAFDRVVMAIMSLLFLTIAIGWFNELRKLIKETRNKSA